MSIEPPQSSRGRLTEKHLELARIKALRLITFSSTIWPKVWADFRDVPETGIMDASEFAYHARRVNDFCSFEKTEFLDVDLPRYKTVVPSGAPFEKNYQYALNRLHHATELKFEWAIWEGNPVYTDSLPNLIASHITVSTDRFPAAHLSLFGLATCFLTSVIPKVRGEYPKLSF